MNEVQPFIDPVMGRYIALALIAVFVLIGIRFSYRALLYRFVFNEPFSNPRIQKMAESLPPHRSTIKAVASFVVAGFITWLTFF
ncbi:MULTISPECIES: hypothetical protein [Pseudomonas]|jgi:hypothetical protein|uniref:hypothetical protein n=1 Tax=Pseudomonas TaxID=286 RepID=UPI0018E7F3F8|nr:MULTISPECIES: hypothetical protein [Pseudomonas]MBJ2214100.1 hypothetical protein [Pseudomonas carnis]MBP5947968.1 hypothetical protein [Pseudomonas sp. P9(2020)]